MGSGWVRARKDLARHPFVLAMARQLRERFLGPQNPAQPGLQPLPALPLNFYRSACAGAVHNLWATADSFIQQGDVLPIGPADIDELTGIEGFCDLMPAEWLQVLDPKSVKLPDFLAHNGSEERRRADSAARSSAYRTRHKNAPSRKNHT